MAFYTINPKNRYKMAWDLFIGVPYLICYWIDPFVISFNYEPLNNSKLNFLQQILTILLLIDMALVPFSATEKKISILSTEKDRYMDTLRLQNRIAKNDIEDPDFERDITTLCSDYMYSAFWWDFLANVPIFLLELGYGFTGDIDELASVSVYRVFMYLKLFRYLSIKRKTTVLKWLKNHLVDIFYLQRVLIENLSRWILAGGKLVLSIHLAACGWILLHRKTKEDADFSTPRFVEDSNFGQYVEAVFFMTSTITTVGYGSDSYKGFV